MWGSSLDGRKTTYKVGLELFTRTSDDIPRVKTERDSPNFPLIIHSIIMMRTKVRHLKGPKINTNSSVGLGWGWNTLELGDGVNSPGAVWLRRLEGSPPQGYG